MMSEFLRTRKTEFSITEIVAHSYNFFSSRFMLFLRLSIGPLLVWSLSELLFDYLLYEHEIIFESTLPRTISTAAFVLMWYRYYLFGKEQATYKKLYAHMRRTSVFSIKMFFISAARMIITVIAILIPTLGISLFMIYYYQMQGGVLNDQVLTNFVNQSVIFASLALSPIFVRLSLYSVAMILGRSKTTFLEVWKKTTGFTWVLWHLTFRAFLPFALYSYMVMGAIRESVAKLDIHYVWASLLTNVPAIFIIYAMLAVVIVANSEAFKKLFGTRTELRT
jgi:hypothetical protein